MPATEQQLYCYMCLVMKDRIEDINNIIRNKTCVKSPLNPALKSMRSSQTDQNSFEEGW